RLVIVLHWTLKGVAIHGDKGQLGHGDTIQRDRPTVVSELSK
ncbi:protein RCC2-like, partial [Trifolium medium]|nr:protein RCC2-like [Trifolium medium]